MILLSLLFLVACHHEAPVADAAATNPPPPGAQPPSEKTSATAVLESRSGSTVTGKVSMTQDGSEVKVTIDLAGASPGNHAVHIHEKGDCSAPDATSAGSHFNPENHDHGDLTMPMHHPGDFGNVAVEANGTGHKELTSASFTLAPGQLLSVDGLAVIVHEKPDDFSQPTGNAGGRQACGIIKVGG
jgi:Cu-Zn family superoxide dismutase